MRAYQRAIRSTRRRPRGLSGHTVNGYLRSLRTFWSWLVREEVLDASPSARVLIPKPPKKIIPAFAETQPCARLPADLTGGEEARRPSKKLQG